MMKGDVIKPYASLSDAIYSRVGRRNIIDWLYSLASIFNISEKYMLPEMDVAGHKITIPGYSLSLTLKHPHSEYQDTTDKSRWYLFNAIFEYPLDSRDKWLCPAVFNLDIDSVTPKSIKKNYGFEMTYLTNADIVRGYRRQSIFMKDGRVVELTWRENMQGIECITVTFMGREIDYINPSDKY